MSSSEEDVSAALPRETAALFGHVEAETALLRKAKEIGCRIQPGRPMMDFQVEAMSEFFDIERRGRGNG